MRTLGAQEKKDPKSDPDSRAEEKPSQPDQALSINEKYVRERLEAYLHPTSLEFLEGGQVKLTFNFRKKNQDQEETFTPKISANVSSSFRWTVRREETYRYPAGKKQAEPEIVGLKLSNSGTALISCWFTDDVQAEVGYAQAVTFNPGQTLALAFVGDNDKGLGSNFGSQCVTLLKGKATGTRGKPEPASFQNETKFKLVVRGGTFAAHRDGREKQTMSYPQKGLESGRIGFVWGGGASGIINSLEIVGKLDLPRMVKEMQKSRSK